MGSAVAQRTEKLLSSFHSLFGPAEPVIYSAPGRAEIGGNHTDHQHGRVLAGSVNMDMLAAAAVNGSGLVNVKSEGYDLFHIDLDCLEPVAGEQGTSAALVRGVCSEIARRGYPIRGFDAFVTSQVMQGSGLSSSAAFEILMGAVVNGLFCGEALNATDLAIIGQKAENRFFGKPCGLMDQMASAWGGIIAIDFRDPAAPVVKPVDFDFAAVSHSLCMIDTGAGHASLTHEYAAIPGELAKVSAFFGKTVLREVPEEDFFADIAKLRTAVGDRALLRAIHIYQENRRVEHLCAALEQGDFPGFLRVIRESGRSSWMYLQNVVATGSTSEQSAALALALCDSVLGDRGAFRIHGGGFGGTVQAFVPDELLAEFQARMEAVFGAGRCHVMKIRSRGFMKVESREGGIRAP